MTYARYPQQEECQPSYKHSGQLHLVSKQELLYQISLAKKHFVSLGLGRNKGNKFEQSNGPWPVGSSEEGNSGDDGDGGVGGQMSEFLINAERKMSFKLIIPL